MMSSACFDRVTQTGSDALLQCFDGVTGTLGSHRRVTLDQYNSVFLSHMNLIRLDPADTETTTGRIFLGTFHPEQISILSMWVFKKGFIIYLFELCIYTISAYSEMVSVSGFDKQFCWHRVSRLNVRDLFVFLLWNGTSSPFFSECFWFKLLQWIKNENQEFKWQRSHKLLRKTLGQEFKWRFFAKNNTGSQVDFRIFTNWAQICQDCHQSSILLKIEHF